MNLHEIAHALGGEVVNGQILAPGPNHSKKDRSLAIRPSWQAPHGFVVHSHAGEDWRDCAAYVRQRLGLPAWGPQQNQPLDRRQPPPRERETDDAAERARNRARELFFEASDARASKISWHYLTIERALGDILDDALSLTLRFHPQCPFKDGEELVRAPALICALRDPRDVMGACQELGDIADVERRILERHELVQAVQRIRLTPDGRKIERRSLGPMANAVVFCGSIWESFYSGAATVAEGVETALAMRRLGFEGCVALAGAGRFRTFTPPWMWEALTVSGENDSASEKAWNAAGERWVATGHRVTIWRPPAGAKDANDILLTAGGKA